LTPTDSSPLSAPDGLVRVLPETLANKIAAGEVVQRPASVLKELLENSLDAGASEVTVVLRKAGSELVQVVDDGCGMGPADAAACFGRHATSKLREVADLDRLRTLGFRGEALASIASVAQVELRTKRRGDAAGTRLRVEGGRATERGPCATPDGTSIAVRHLFFNVPARRNFLKTPATEFKHLVETFQFVALSHPRVGFTLLHDEHEVYRLAASPTPFEEALRARLAELFGERLQEGLVPVAETTSYLSVRGYVGRPEISRRSRGEQFLFVNDRYVRHRGLEHAVASAYEGLVGSDARPLFALFLTLDPRHVDVNVHPTKTEVKFDDERGVYGFLRAVVKKALGDADLTPSFGDGMGEEPAAPPPGRAFPAWDDDSAETPSASRPAPVALGSWSGRPRPASFSAPLPGDPEAVPSGAPYGSGRIPSEARPVVEGSLEAEELGVEAEPPVWQLHGRYLVTPIRSGLLLVDQRAAHERILYEQAVAAMEGGLSASQQLVFPIVLELGPADVELLGELLPDLRSLGFHVEPFGGRTVKVHGVPADIRPGREQTILEEILEQYKQYRDGLQLVGRDALAKSFARRRAIRPGQPLAEREARALIDQLFACSMPYTCPHGRQVMVKMTMDELERRFARG
jgi:DNA mismatch repair protein MutL